MSDYMDECDLTDADWLYVDMYIEQHQFDKADRRERNMNAHWRPTDE